MHRKMYLVLFISLLAVAWFGLHTVNAGDLPASTWYAVLHLDKSDQLAWINADGEQARMGYPYLPNENVPESARDLRISPDGRYGIFTGTLMDNRMALGFYDFQQGLFMQVHSAQPNEKINLGHWNSFLSDTSGVAVAFYTETDAGISDWRIIEFDPKTGNVLHLLQKADNAFTEPNVGLGRYPYVFYAQDGLGYRFQMIPYAVGGSVNYEGFTWNPTADTVTPIGTVTTEIDILPTTNYMIESGYEVGLPSVSLEGPIPILNVVTQRNAFEVAPTQLFHDPNASLFSPRWLRNGEWYAYHANMPNDESNWVIRSVVGDNSFTFDLNMTPRMIYGTSEGYLLDYEGKTFIASTELDSSNQPVIFETAPDQTAKVVYVTPIGSLVSFTFLADPGLIDGPTNTPAAQQPVTCEDAPPIRLAAGMTARVTFTNGTVLRVRQAPGGTIITELSEGTGFKVVEGPICQGGFNWWKIELEVVNGGTLTGWSAEGDADNYYIEPFQPNAPIPPLAITPLVFVTVQPPVAQITPLVAVTVQQPIAQITPLVAVTVQQPVLQVTPMVLNTGFIVDGDCSKAVAQYLSVGALVTAQPEGTLAMRDTPAAELPSAQIASGVSGTIIDGPLCHKGFRRWKVEFNSGQTGWVPDSFGNKLYLKKG